MLFMRVLPSLMIVAVSKGVDDLVRIARVPEEKITSYITRFRTTFLRKPRSLLNILGSYRENRLLS